MEYSSLRACVEDLERQGQLMRIKDEVDPNLEMAEIHRQIYDAGGPAILYERVKGSPFQALSNLYGTWSRTKYLFKDQLPKVERLVQLKLHPEKYLKQPWRLPAIGLDALVALPRQVRSPLSTRHHTSIDQLPMIKSWPEDGGAFITMPQVLTLPPDAQQIMQSNIGMYRIQLSGNEYKINEEIGLHYQLHRGIGVHHRLYLESSEEMKVSIFIGGPPSHAVAAIMPLPEGMSETTFMGLLGGRRFRYAWEDGYLISADADFVITGVVDKDLLKPEGPFGDHLGYYSLQHLFPYMRVHKVWHRPDPIWHFTVVGRPPQEDTNFGRLIHHIVADLTPSEFPGLRSLHAVDEAGVHPLLIAVGSERYMPFRDKKPEEILTIANHLLGKGQTSLAKYLIIADGSDQPDLHAANVKDVIHYALERIDTTRDLHFYTNWTIDTLDYSGHDWNQGSKLVIAAAGESRRVLKDLPQVYELPDWCEAMSCPMSGVLALSLKTNGSSIDLVQIKSGIINDLEYLGLDGYPMIVLCDDAHFIAESLANFLWVTFTRSNPAYDVHGIGEVIEHKHWGCSGSFIIDARIKHHHAPMLTVPAQLRQSVSDKIKHWNMSIG